MFGKLKKPTIKTTVKSVSVSDDMLVLAQRYRISLTEATRVGLAVLLSEEGCVDFINRTNVGRRIDLMTRRINELSQTVQENVLQT